MSRPQYPGLNKQHRLPTLAVPAILLLAAALVSPQEVPATRQPEPPTVWPHYAGDQGTQRYAPLPALTRDNFSSLIAAWLFTSPDEGLPAQLVALTLP